MDWDELWENQAVDFFDALSEHTGVPRSHPKWGVLWNLAWEHGHSAGITEVVYYFEEFAELIK
jgi:hypothetical protein